MIPNKNKKKSNNRACLHYEVSTIICGKLFTQRDCQNWHHCVEAGGSLELAALKSVGVANLLSSTSRTLARKLPLNCLMSYVKGTTKEMAIKLQRKSI